jgi:hypothetical protein
VLTTLQRCCQLLGQFPRMDGKDTSEFHTKISAASHENVQAARVLERMIWDALGPARQAAVEKVKRFFRSKHRSRWGDEYDSYD